MIRPGLVSITFRKLSAREIVKLVAESGLQGIEWGGDIHVPHGRIDVAREVAAMTRDAGLQVAAYGSYYRADGNPQLPFDMVLETAVTLGAPYVRIWAGKIASAVASPQERGKIVGDLRLCAEKTRAAGIIPALEYHGNTLTDTAESATALMQELEGSGMRLYWQPPVGMNTEAACQNLQHVLKWVDHVHVFHWSVVDEKIQRHVLAEGAPSWNRYLQILQTEKKERWAMLEFVSEDAPGQLREDARTLRDWLNCL